MAEYLKKAFGVGKKDQTENSIFGFKIDYAENTERESSDFNRDSHYCPAGEIVKILQEIGGISAIWIDGTTLWKLEPHEKIFILQSASITKACDVLFIGHVTCSYNIKSSLMYQIQVLTSQMHCKKLKMGMKVYFKHHEKCAFPLAKISLERKRFSKITQAGTRLGSHIDIEDDDSCIEVVAENGSPAGSRFESQIGARVHNNTLAEITNDSPRKPQVNTPMEYQPVCSSDKSKGFQVGNYPLKDHVKGDPISFISTNLRSLRMRYKIGTHMDSQKEKSELSQEFGPQLREKLNILIEESNTECPVVLEVENAAYQKKVEIQEDLPNGSWEEISRNEIMESSIAEDFGFELI